MLIRFRPDGTIAEFHTETPANTTGGIVYDYPIHIAKGLFRAHERGRLSQVDGKLYLDDTAFVPPPARETVSYLTLLARINALSVPAGAKAVLVLLADLLLEHGKLEV